MVMSTGEAIAVGGVSVVLAGVALIGKVESAAVPAGFWPVICVSVLDWLCRLQAERTATSASAIDGNLNVFNFASKISY
jgi:hypothetical protein